MELSIIIPYSPFEDELSSLLSDFEKFDSGNYELILVGENDSFIPEKFKKCFVKSKLGRATQQNLGAQEAKGKFLWFLHADSRITHSDIEKFLGEMKENPDSLIYLNLKFSKGLKRMILNEIGTRFRSAIFKLPFGDQGLGVSKENFKKIGGFPEIPMGEDLLFVKKSKRAGLKLKNCGGIIHTSPRKYEKNGWLKTTLNHLFHTFRLSFTKSI